MGHAVSFRAVSLPEDAELLLEIFASTRQRELRALGWPEPEARDFLISQFRAQSEHFDLYHRSAEHCVVLVAGVPAGRTVVERSETEIKALELSLLPEFRGAGIGTQVVRDLLAEADVRGVPVTCHVELGSAARRFWQRLGFVPRGSDGAYVALERPCGTSLG